MNENVFDVFGIPTVAIPDNAVLQWDGCDWKFIELPASTLTCQDIVDCVQPELDNLWAAVNGKLECSDLAACQTIIDIVADVAALPASILSQIMYYTQTNNDGANTTKLNGATTEFTGMMGLQVTTNTISEAIEVALPGGATDGDVMIWDETLGSVVRGTVIDCLCEQIATCSIITALQFAQTSLQNQINYLMGLDPSSQPVLTCSDVANCIWIGATDVDSALDHFITSRSNWVDLLVNIQDIETEISTITIRDCNDVMACSGIIDLVGQVAVNDGRITALENCCGGALAVLEGGVTIDDNVVSIVFDAAGFDVTQSSPGVVNVSLIAPTSSCASMVAELTGCSNHETLIDSIIDVWMTTVDGMAAIRDLGDFSNFSLSTSLAYTEATISQLTDRSVYTLDDTPEIRLPEITVTDAALHGRMLSVYCVAGSSAPVTITGLAGATILGTPTVPIGESRLVIIRSIGAGNTEYLVVGG